MSFTGKNKSCGGNSLSYHGFRLCILWKSSHQNIKYEDGGGGGGGL